MARKVFIHSLLFSVLAHLASSTTAPVGQHRTFQYNTVPDETGAYNFAYDTGSRDAHSMRMEARDHHGIVRGRYGYTDPTGKLRMVEYEAGPEGFMARGDTGPDLSLHGETPSFKSVHLRNPTHLQLTGWDPVANPIHPGGSLHGHHVGNINLSKKTIDVVPARIDHPVKGYQAPIPIIQKTEFIRLAPPPKNAALVAPVRIDHPVKGYEAPRPIIQKAEQIIIGPPPKSLALVAPATLSHPVKGYQSPKAVVQEIVELYPPPKSSALVAPPKTYHHVKSPVAVPIVQETEVFEFDRHVSKSIPKSAPVIVSANVHHPVKGHAVPKSIIQAAPLVRLEPPPKSVALVAPVKSHQVKHLQPIIQERVPIALDHHSEKAFIPQKSISVVAPSRLEHAHSAIIQKSAGVKAPVVHVNRQHHHHHHVEEIKSPKSVYVQPVVAERVHHSSDKGYSHPKHVAAHLAPVVATKVDHHHVKGYTSSKTFSDVVLPAEYRTDHHHHNEKGHAHPKTVVRTAAVTKSDHHHYDSPKTVVRLAESGVDYHSDKHSKSVVRVSPIVESRVSHHHDHSHKSPKTITKVAPVVERRVYPHDHYRNEKGYSRPVAYISPHTHQHNRPTIHNIDVDPNEIRRTAPPSQHHHYTSHSTEHYTNPRVATDYSVDAGIVVHDHSSPRRYVVRDTNTRSLEEGHVGHVSSPRRVTYSSSTRYGPGIFTFE